MSPAPVVEKAYYISDFHGWDFQLQLGTNREGEYALRFGGRLTGTNTWHMFCEMLLDFENYYQDTATGFTNPKNPPPPPPA